MAASFLEYVFGQGFRSFAVLAVPALVFLIAFAGALLLGRRRWGTSFVQATVISTAAVLLVAVLGIALFEAAALWYRTERLSTRFEDFEDYFAWAKVGFLALYSGLVLLALGGGWVVGHVRARRGTTVAIVCGLAVVTYLGLTLPMVEFLNACDVGRSFIIDDVRC
jgi:hypothetical protein